MLHLGNLFFPLFALYIEPKSSFVNAHLTLMDIRNWLSFKTVILKKSGENLGNAIQLDFWARSSILRTAACILPMYKVKRRRKNPCRCF